MNEYVAVHSANSFHCSFNAEAIIRIGIHKQTSHYDVPKKNSTYEKQKKELV